MSLHLQQRLRIVLAGGSGPVGSALAASLQAEGHHVTVLTRSPYTANYQTVHWDGATPGPWLDALESANVCIHLSGPNLAGRPTAEHNQRIHRERLHGIHLFASALNCLRCPPQAWMLGSTADIYRHCMDQPQDETTGVYGGWEKISRFRRAPARWTFAATLARECEEAFFNAEIPPETRRVALRLGTVMSTEPRSEFDRLARRVRLSLGGWTGSGRQVVSWIHELDLTRAVLFLAEHADLDGVFNLTAPGPVRNRALMAALREELGVPNGFPAPGLLVELAERLNGAAHGSVLKSRWVVPTRLLDAGFRFEFPDWTEAAAELAALWKRRN